jgi:hypothetical protein
MKVDMVVPSGLFHTKVTLNPQNSAWAAEQMITKKLMFDLTYFYMTFFKHNNQH